MNNQETLINTLFERENLSAHEIAAHVDIPVEAVELCLAKKQKNLEKNDGELRKRIDSYKDLALETIAAAMQDPDAPAGVKTDAAKYILDVSLGQKPEKVSNTPQQLSITQINHYIIEAKRMANADRAKHEPIEVAATITS